MKIIKIAGYAVGCFVGGLALAAVAVAETIEARARRKAHISP